MEYLTGSMGGKDEYLVVTENDGIALGLKPTLSSWGGLIGVKLRAARKDGSEARKELFVEAFPKVPFSAVSEKRASKEFTRKLNAGSSQIKYMTPEQVGPIIKNVFEFLFTMDVVPSKKGEKELIAHLTRFWSVDPDFAVEFTDEGWADMYETDEADSGDGAEPEEAEA